MSFSSSSGSGSFSKSSWSSTITWQVEHAKEPSQAPTKHYFVCVRMRRRLTDTTCSTFILRGQKSLAFPIITECLKFRFLCSAILRNIIRSHVGLTRLCRCPRPICTDYNLCICPLCEAEVLFVSYIHSVSVSQQKCQAVQPTPSERMISLGDKNLYSEQMGYSRKEAKLPSRSISFSWAASSKEVPMGTLTDFVELSFSSLNVTSILAIKDQV